MKRVLLIIAMFSGLKTAAADEPLKHVCTTKAPSVEVRIAGRRGDLIEIVDTKTGLAYLAYDEGRSEMGGKDGALTCGDVRSGRHLIAIRTGWKNDYMHFFGVNRDANGALVLDQYRYLPRDHPYDISRIEALGDNSRATHWQGRNGKKNDRYYAVCYHPRIGFTHFDKKQIGAGFRNCTARIPATDIRRVSANQTPTGSKLTDRTVNPPPPRVPPIQTGVRYRCRSTIGTGSIEFFGRGHSCSEALSNARKEAQRLGGCLRLGSNHSFIREEVLNTPSCPLRK
ncbi:MAG: hypothetical protein AAF141_01525 [Pseudomonadota bacterium]